MSALRPALLAALAVSTLVTGLRAEDDGYVKPALVRIHVDGPLGAAVDRVFAAGGDVVARGKGWIDALVPADAVAAGSYAGVAEGDRVEVIRSDADAELRAFAGREAVGAYHTYAEVKAELDAAVAARPDLVRYESIGKTVEGRPIHAVRVGGPASEGKPAFLICGLHHSREWISIEPPMALLQWLIGSDPTAQAMTESREIWIVPVVNPDGLEYSQTQYKMWRKNRAKNADGSVGVDPNRNYGYKWGLPGASPDPGSETYRGPSAFSEPEIQAIRDLGLREKFVSVLSFHSYSELVLWPWGFTYDPAPDDDVLAAHGRKMGELTGYTPQQSSDLYPTSGDFDDWFYGELGALAYTFELGTQFVPPESEIPAIVAANMKALKYFLAECADPFPLMTHVPRSDTTDTQGPYGVVLQLSRRYQADDPVAKAELVYKNPGAEDWTRLDLVKGEAGAYASEIPGSGLGTVEYHFEVADKAGTSYRFPREGEYRFQVVDQLYLVVDDDAGKGYESAYAGALAAAGLPHVVVPAAALTESQLLGASAVLWLTGDDSSTTIEEKDEALLSSFLSKGGELMLFGQDIGYDIKERPFFAQVLKAKFVKDKSDVNDLVGAGGLAGFTSKLNQAGAVAQRYPEVIAPLAGASLAMSYGAGAGAGAAVAVDGPGRVLYFGFGLEGLAGAEVQKDLVTRALAWLKAGGASRMLRRAEALRALGGDASALAGLEAALLDEARRLGAREDRAGLEALLSDASEFARRPLLQAYMQALFPKRR